MPAERLPMRKVREVLRQRYACGASERVIAQSLGIGRTAVGEYIRRAAVIGITWPVPGELDDPALERKLFAPAGYNPPQSKPLPDWAEVHGELRRRRRDAALLWEELSRAIPTATATAASASSTAPGEARLSPTMRQTHVAGEQAVRRLCRRRRLTVIDRDRPARCATAQIFVAVLGASNYTYAEATLDAGAVRLDRRAHVSALRVHRRRAGDGGVRQSARSGSPRPASTSRRSTAPMPRWRPHYGTAIAAGAAVRRPRDKTIASYCTLS